MSILLEPFPPFTGLRIQRIDLIPESRRMIEMNEMSHFMRSDIVNDVKRRLDQPPVKPDAPIGMANAPLGTGVGQGKIGAPPQTAGETAHTPVQQALGAVA